MSTLNALEREPKKRGYRLGKRAEKQQETRRRIVEAAIDLHSRIGPAQTSIAQIADRAGVQRHTFYSHFPDERGLLIACSGLSLERDPLPDPEEWLETGAGRERIRQGLDEIYGWYERNAEMAGCVLRDAEHHEPTREIVAMRLGPMFDRAAEILGESLDERSRALLRVAMDFACWRALQQSHPAKSAAGLMADAVDCLNRRPHPR